MATWVQPPNTPKADFFPGPWSDVSASRTVNTSYGGGTTARIIIIYGRADSGDLHLRIGNTDPPGTSDAFWHWGATNAFGFGFVPPGEYYELEASSTATIIEWLELDL